MNINTKHRYLIQLSVQLDSIMFNAWDYVESVATLEEALELCDGLFDTSVHKLQIADAETNTIIMTWS